MLAEKTVGRQLVHVGMHSSKLVSVLLHMLFLSPQEFKGNYRAWNTRPPMPPIHNGMVAGNGGLVPLPNGDWHAMAVDPNAPPPAVRG